jgi:hypothetical protein
MMNCIDAIGNCQEVRNKGNNKAGDEKEIHSRAGVRRDGRGGVNI